MRLAPAAFLLSTFAAALPGSAKAGTPSSCFKELKQDVGAAVRLKCLAPHFDPAPGAEARLDRHEIRENRKTSPLELRGSINVTPPAGTCFTITRTEDIADLKVCQPTQVTFRAADLDEGGSFSWKISTGTGDFGSTLSWKTPHRIARVMKPMNVVTEETLKKPTREDFEGLSILKKVVIEKCTIDPKVAKNDRWKKTRTFPVVLTLTDGRDWVIHFPETDQLAKDQGKKIDNVYIQTFDSTATFSEKPKEGGAKPEGAEATPTPEVTEGEAKSEFADFTAIAGKAKAKREMWVVPPWGAFQISSSDFVDISAPHGLKGICRYHLKNAPKDPERGWIECHGAAGYEVVIAPLACTDQLVRWRSESIKTPSPH